MRYRGRSRIVNIAMKPNRYIWALAGLLFFCLNFHSSEVYSQSSIKIKLSDKKFFKTCRSTSKGSSKKIFTEIENLQDRFERKFYKLKAKQKAEWIEEANSHKDESLALVRLLFPQALPEFHVAKSVYVNCWSRLYEMKRGMKSSGDWRTCIENIYGGRPSPYVLRIINCIQPTESPKAKTPSRGKRPSSPTK